MNEKEVIMSDEYDWECTDCELKFDRSPWTWGTPPKCPCCGRRKHIVSTEIAEENRRVNAQEEYNESMREK